MCRASQQRQRSPVSRPTGSPVGNSANDPPPAHCRGRRRLHKFLYSTASLTYLTKLLMGTVEMPNGAANARSHVRSMSLRDCEYRSQHWAAMKRVMMEKKMMMTRAMAQ